MRRVHASMTSGFRILGMLVLASGALAADVPPELKNLAPGTIVETPAGPPTQQPAGGPFAFDYPSDDSNIVGSVGFIDGEQVGYFWSMIRGDEVEETFSGPPSASAYSLDVDVIENSLNNGAFCNWDVIINGVTVDNFTVDEGFLGTVSQSGSFAPIAGPDYTIELRVTNEVAGGEGSHTFRYAGVGANQVELFEQPVPATPPVALVLLAVLLLAGGALLYRRHQELG